MSREAAPEAYCPNVRWKTLFAYERALRGFMRTDPPDLPFSAFARVSAMDVRTLPEARYVELDGQSIGYRRYDADSDVRLVLVHGAGCFGDQLHEMARRIAQSGKAQVYTLNMRGHGLSDGERGHAVTYPGQIIRDVGRFLEIVHAERPRDRIILGGHSAGGGVVLGVSRTCAHDLISGYVFLAPYLGLGSPTVRPHFGGWTHLHGKKLRAVAMANLFGIKRFNDETVVDFNRDACLHDPRFIRSWSFNTMLAFGAGPWLYRTDPIPADTPVLLLAGERDECFFQPLYPDALETVAPHADMPSVGQCGHWDLLVDPVAIAELGAWLELKFPKNANIVTLAQEKNDAAAA